MRIARSPEVPCDEGGLSKLNLPLRPFSALAPLMILTLPPLLFSDSPAINDKDEPIPLPEDPTITLISPALASIALPVESSIEPVSLKKAEPLPMITAPLDEPFESPDFRSTLPDVLDPDIPLCNEMSPPGPFAACPA